MIYADNAATTKMSEAAIKEIESEQKLPQLPPDEAIRRLKYVIDNFDDSDEMSRKMEGLGI